MQPVERYDVVVAGGGSAGVAAAIAAAELGARTLLVERGARLGGNVAHALVHTICGLYRAADEGHALVLNPGLPARLAAALRAAGAAGEVERVGRVFVLPIEPPRYAACLEAICARTRGLELRSACALEAAELDEERVPRWQLRVCARTGRAQAGMREHTGRSQAGVREHAAGALSFTAHCLVDASGDANAAALAGASLACAGADTAQLPSFIFRMKGVERSACAGFAPLRLSHALAGAVAHGELPPGNESVLVRAGLEPDEVYVTLNLPRATAREYSPLDEARLAELTARARDDAQRIAQFLGRTRPAFEKAQVCAWPERVGVRETRRVQGLRELGALDVLAGRSDPDEIARSSWPLELWRDHRRAHFEYPSGACSIPLGALVSRSRPQLGMAGRCLSASHEALGALRVIGTALATGEAIGVAAALAAGGGVALDSILARAVREQILARADQELAP